MFIAPPSTSKPRWVYDDPSGVAEPTAFPRPWRPRLPKRSAQVTVLRNRRVRVTHVEN